MRWCGDVWTVITFGEGSRGHGSPDTTPPITGVYLANCCLFVRVIGFGQCTESISILLDGDLSRLSN